MPKINSLEVVHQDTNQDSYQNLHDILVALNKSLALEKEVVDTDARASIENLLEMYVNDKEAFLRSLTVLAAEFKASQAQYSEEIMLKASELEALARKITSLSAVVQDNNAAIYTEQGARVTADEALAYSIETVSATVGSKNRTYYQSTAPSTTLVNGDLWIDSDDDKLYRWDGSSWVNVQDNQIGVNTAAITNEATARANGDSANATAINAVTARLDTGDFAAVKVESSATASRVDGVEGRWGVTINAQGNVNGIQLLNGSNGTSDFIVAARRFVVRDNATTPATDKIVWDSGTNTLKIAGDVYANTFYGNVVSTDNINANAVTVPTSSSSTSPSLLGSSYTTYLSSSISLNQAGYVYATLCAALGFPSNPSNSWHRLLINGQEVFYMNTGAAFVQSIALAGTLYCNAGTVTIEYQARSQPDAGQSGVVYVNNRHMGVQGAKR